MISSWRSRRAAHHAAKKNRSMGKSNSEDRILGVDSTPRNQIPLTSQDVSQILLKLVSARDKGDLKSCLDIVVNLKALVKESQQNMQCVAGSGTSSLLSATFETFSLASVDENFTVLEEILSAITMLLPLDTQAKSCLGSDSSLRGIVQILGYGDLSAQKNAVLVMKEIILSLDTQKMDDLEKIQGVAEVLVEVIKEPICPTTTKASLVAIYHMVNSSSKEKLVPRFVSTGLVEMLINMVVESERSVCEKALGVLDRICVYREGREKLYNHALTVPALVKKILRVSDLATEFSVSILWVLRKNQETEGREEPVLVAALQAGAFQKLLLLLQVGCSERTREKATELLRWLHPHRDLECIDSMDFKHLKKPF